MQSMIYEFNSENITKNILRFWEEKETNGKKIRTEFQQLTSIRITKKNAEKIAAAGRKRWKIENEGFNRQKNWQGDITHACSQDATAMKNHYLMVQTADMVKQLYEWFFLKKNEIKKKQKIYLLNCQQALDGKEGDAWQEEMWIKHFVILAGYKQSLPFRAAGDGYHLHFFFKYVMLFLYTHTCVDELGGSLCRRMNLWKTIWKLS